VSAINEIIKLLIETTIPMIIASREVGILKLFSEDSH